MQPEQVWGFPGVADNTSEKKESTKLFTPPREPYFRFDDEGDNNWLVSYADMMTLLFGFFVILTAFSIPDPGKLEKMKRATAKSMNIKYQVPYSELAGSMKAVLSDFKLESDVAINETDEGLAIVSKGTLFFDSSSTKLKPEAKALIERIADVLALQAKQFRIVVEGHTDDTPIESKFYPSNWELSAARAGTVVRLLEEKGLPHGVLRPVGLADTEPLAQNRENGVVIPENQAKNRRIVLRIQRQLPSRL